jgi:hypothetical protein
MRPIEVAGGTEETLRQVLSIKLIRKELKMPEQETRERAEEDKREGKSPSTQAGEYVHEEIKHVRKGKHGARSAKQAIAIGLSKARRAGVKLPAKKGTSNKTQKQAARDIRKGQTAGKKKSAKRSRATSQALKREGRSAASKTALSRQARSAAAKRSAASRSRAAKKAAATRKK